MLVVDDSADAAALTAKMLCTVGWTVDIANGGQAALDLIWAKTHESVSPYRAVYIDWQVPQMGD